MPPRRTGPHRTAPTASPDSERRCLRPARPQSVHFPDDRARCPPNAAPAFVANQQPQLRSRPAANPILLDDRDVVLHHQDFLRNSDFLLAHAVDGFLQKGTAIERSQQDGDLGFRLESRRRRSRRWMIMGDPRPISVLRDSAGRNACWFACAATISIAEAIARSANSLFAALYVDRLRSRRHGPATDRNGAVFF